VILAFVKKQMKSIAVKSYQPYQICGQYAQLTWKLFGICCIFFK